MTNFDARASHAAIAARTYAESAGEAFRDVVVRGAVMTLCAVKALAAGVKWCWFRFRGWLDTRQFEPFGDWW